LHRALDTAGALVGVLGAALLLWWLSGSPQGTTAAQASADARPYRVIFAIAAGLGLVAAALTFLVREAAPAATSPVVPSQSTDEPGRRLDVRHDADALRPGIQPEEALRNALDQLEGCRVLLASNDDRCSSRRSLRCLRRCPSGLLLPESLALFR